MLIKIFNDGQTQFGPREWSPNIIERLQDTCDTEFQAQSFPDEMTDDELGEPDYEIIPTS